MAEFLLELFSEEIPAGMQARAAADLERLVTAGLKEAGLEWSATDAHATPRRLVVWVDGLPLAQPDVKEERKGPKVDAPEKAIAGFLRSNGLTLEQCEQRETPKGTVWFALIERLGRPTGEVLVEIIDKALRELPWPKSMRWSEGGFRWVRPLHHILALFDGMPLVGEFEPHPKSRFVFSALVRGHRFLAPDAVPVATYGDYKQALADGFVVLDREERKALILDQATKLAKAEKLQLRDDPGLVDEVAGLVEWPVAHLGRIDDEFMDVPPEVLITSMRSHQRYFALETKDGALAPYFVVVANRPTKDGGAAVIDGNERVLRARLSDAKFFWDQDLKVKLEDRVPALKQIIFHAKLGTVEDRVLRLQTLAADLAEIIPGAEPDRARSAALLAKADLTSGMVVEFPELQGVMGRYYARAEGETEEVAEAIAQHYSPLGPNDACPTAPTSVAVALADKIDTMVGFFAIDEKPTGSRDPYALRRAALGVIRLIVENGLRLGVTETIGGAWRLYDTQGVPVRPLEETSADLLAFFADRLKVTLREKGVRHDLVDAVFALGGEDDLVRLLARVEALGAFLDSDDGANLLVAYRRAANIVRIESKKDKRAYDDAVDGSLLKEDGETALVEALDRVTQAVDPLLAAEHFVAAMEALAALRGPVDRFFDTVTVNADDAALRGNRLCLLTQITATMNRIAVFSKIEG